MRHILKRTKSKMHNTETCDMYKISLSCFNDKSHILDDGIKSLAY